MNDVTPIAPFTVFPAIDLRSGQVVRLKEGDPNRQTDYAADSAEAAARWMRDGARWLHVVNLDGAFDQSDSVNLAALKCILAVASAANIPVQFGGGLRSLAAMENAFTAGVERVMIGTLAVEQPDALDTALQRWGAQRVGVSLDARGGMVAVRGWQSTTTVAARDLARDLALRGLKWLVFTDIARDGLQTGLNLPATQALAEGSGLNVIASGGVARIQDVIEARTAGLAGAIVGRALYEGAIDPAALFALDR